MSCLLSSFTRSSSASMSARMTVFFRRLASGASSKVNRETSILLILAECNLSALVILVELASATADLPLGVMNFSSSSSKEGPFFFLFSEEKQILVCCLYLLGTGARENQLLKESKLQGRGKRLSISSKKYQFLRYPAIRYKFFTYSKLISPSAASISNRSTMFLYCRHTALRNVYALSKFWISSSNSWQNFFFRGYSNSLLRSGISPSSFRNWQKSSKLRVLLQPHFFRNRSAPLLISSSWLAYSSAGTNSQSESLMSWLGCLVWKLQVKVLIKAISSDLSISACDLGAMRRQQAKLLKRSNQRLPRAFSRSNWHRARKLKQCLRTSKFMNKNYKTKIKMLFTYSIQQQNKNNLGWRYSGGS